LVPYLRKSVALARAQTQDLGELKPPPVFVRRFARMQTIGRAETAAAAQVIGALQAGGQARAHGPLLPFPALLEQDNPAPTGIGLTACAKAAPTGCSARARVRSSASEARRARGAAATSPRPRSCRGWSPPRRSRS